MNTEPNREAAKQGVLSREQTDPELAQALTDAHSFQLDLAKENNRHARSMRDAELGMFGRIFGGGNSTPTYVALICAIAGIVLVVGCYIAAAKHPDQADYWGKQAERCFAFATASLAFIFGRATSNA